jgi:hypothetical protein
MDRELPVEQAGFRKGTDRHFKIYYGKIKLIWKLYYMRFVD